MGALASVRTVIAAPVANNGAFDVAYPPGASQALLNGHSQCQIMVGEAVYKQYDGQFDVTFGASAITLTNRSGETWPVAVALLTFGRVDRVGVYSLVIGTTALTAKAGSASGGAAPVLATLTLSSAAFTAGAAAGTVIGTISGKTAGSTITVTPNDGRLAVSSDGTQLLVGVSASSAGTINATLTETLAGATGSPKDTAVAVTVSAALPSWLLFGEASRGINFAGKQEYGNDARPSLVANSTADGRYCRELNRYTSQLAIRLDGTYDNTPSGGLNPTDAGQPNFINSTNFCLQNRDLTQAVWTKTNVTAAKNQAGLINASLTLPPAVNTASSITATAANGTILQSITLASGSKSASVHVKRLVGTGTLEMTMDGGTTWVALTVPASGWSRQTAIPSQIVTDPMVGFRIATSGDSFAIDLVQLENYIPPATTVALMTAPIPTTTAAVQRTRNRLSCFFNDGSGVDNGFIGNWKQATGDAAIYIEWCGTSPVGTAGGSDGPLTFPVYAGQYLDGRVNKLVRVVVNNIKKTYLNGALVATADDSATRASYYTAFTHIDLNGSNNGALIINGQTRMAQTGSWAQGAIPYTEAQLIAMTTGGGYVP